MDLVPVCLTREEILKILEQRHLQITDLQHFSYDELVRVFKTFALPLSRRPQRTQNRYCLNNQQTISNEDHQICSGNDVMDIDLDGNLNTHIKSGVIGEKRRPTEEDLEDLNHLSRATKRIKINTMP